jgi:hypothetical protein
MAVLDCESLETSLKSICAIYGTTKPKVVRFLSRVDLEAEYEKKTIPKGCDDYLKDLFESEFGTPIQRLEKVFWFHLTRVPAGTNFVEGLLPLHLALDPIWRMVLSIPRNPTTRMNLDKLRKEGVPDDPYISKVSSRTELGGPCAMLIRESAFHATAMTNRDHLALPEIVEDICNGYRILSRL